MSVNKLETQKQSVSDKEAAEDLAFFAKEIEYFETHDMSEELAASPEVHFEINLPPRKPRFAIEAALAAELHDVAHERGVSAETLLNEWVREKVSKPWAVRASNDIKEVNLPPQDKARQGKQ